MGLFDKKYCDICGEKIGLLGNRKLEDGNMCKNCAKKLSPFFEERRQSTLEEIKAQLEYREANKLKVEAFNVTRQYEGSSLKIFIDDGKGEFAVGHNLDVEDNPDIILLSQITSCKMDIDEHRHEEKYKDDEGNMKSYFPARYKYSYDYKVVIFVDSPWFDDISIPMNTFSIDDYERRKLNEVEQNCNEIIMALTGGFGGQNMYRNMGGQNMMNQGMPQHATAMNMAPNMAQNSAPVHQGAQAGTWVCTCGTANTGNFCQSCGQPKPAANSGRVQCDKCGWVCDDPNNIPKFCPQCGDPINAEDMK